MQVNGEFIPNFAKLTAPVRKLSMKNERFIWTTEHASCFYAVLDAFKKDTLLRYFDPSKKTNIFTDAHVTGLGAILAQEVSLETARPVALASKTTNEAEKHNCQLDLECIALDFGLRRFRSDVIGSPQQITVVVDHKPLESVFNGARIGSIRTERIKMRHQDIRYIVHYSPDITNPTDYLSRNGTAYKNIPESEKEEAEDLKNLIFMLHLTPYADAIGFHVIAAEKKMKR